MLLFCRKNNSFAHPVVTCNLLCRYLGTYIGTLFLLLKRDIPRLIGLFIVINFSFGGGLYFALIGQYDDSSVDELNNNDTRYASCMF